MRRYHARGGLHLRVEMPDGARFQVPASWTTLVPVDPGFVPLVSELARLMVREAAEERLHERQREDRPQAS